MVMGGPETGGGTGVPPDWNGARPKARRSGFRTLLYVLVAVGGVLVLTCAGVLVFVPEIRQTFSAAMASQSAPGTDELRAAGCAQAGVMDLGAALGAIVEEQRAETGEPPEIPTLYVSCQKQEEAELDCDRVAAVYVGAVGQASARFVAQVNDTGFAPELLCQAVYDTDGTRLGTIEELAPE